MSGIAAEGYCSRCEGWDYLRTVDTETDEHGIIGLCSTCYNEAVRLAEGDGGEVGD